MKPKTIIPLVMGVVVGGVAIKIVVDAVSSAQAATAANMAKCVVAKVDIEFADEITPEKLELREWPKDSLPPQYFSSIDELKNRVSSVYIPRDVPVFPSMLAPQGTPPGIKTRIGAGYRAVSIAIDEVTGVAYQVKPGDRVDVVALVRQRSHESKSNDMVSRIILQNVEVAAVGRTIDAGKGSDSTKKTVARSVTLLLSPNQVTELHLAQSLGGRLALALRGSNDEAQTDSTMATADTLLNSAPEQQISEFPEPPQPPQTTELAARPQVETRTITVLHGNNLEIVEFEKVDGMWRLRDESGMGSYGVFSAPAGGSGADF